MLGALTSSLAHRSAGCCALAKQGWGQEAAVLGSENDLIWPLFKLIFSVAWLRRTKERAGDSCRQDGAQEEPREARCGGWGGGEQRGCAGRLGARARPPHLGGWGPAPSPRLILGDCVGGEKPGLPGTGQAGGRSWPASAPCPGVVAAGGAGDLVESGSYSRPAAGWRLFSALRQRTLTAFPLGSTR